MYKNWFISNADFNNRLSQYFRSNQQQDHLVVAWLLASMTTPILTKMVGYQHPFPSHLLRNSDSKIQLRQPKKATTVTSYLLHIKKIIHISFGLGKNNFTVLIVN